MIKNGKHSQETKKKISEVLKDRKCSKEHIRKNSEAHKGKKHSIKTLRKMSEARKGKRRSALNPGFAGHKHSTETKTKQSKTHKGKKHSEEHRRKNSEAKRGDKSVFWKGGRRKNSDGYISIYSPTHPYAKRRHVLEHRLVMEKHLGRILLPTEIVHHINDIRNDNRIENLMLFSDHRQHISLHRKQKKKLKPLSGLKGVT